MLAQQSFAFPVGLILKPGGEVEVSVAAYENAEQVEQLVNAMLGSMIERASATSALAACISVPDARGQSVVAFLENRDNYCVKVSIPVSADTRKLDAEKVTVEDGSVHVFPMASR